MIISKEVEIIINSSNFKKYKSLGYNIKCKDKIIVPVTTLSNRSSFKIEAKCDFCDNIKTLSFLGYNISLENGGMFSCSKKCSLNKTRKTNLLKYGTESHTQNKEIKDKTKLTNLKKFGVENVSQSDIIKNKKIKTLMSNYGVTSPLKCKEILEKMQKTNLEKYGEIYFVKTEQYKIKAKETNIEKYGAITYSQTDKCKEQSKKTCLLNFGVDNYSKTKEFKTTINKKTKETCMLKYGVDNVFKMPEFRTKAKNTSLLKFGVEYPIQNVDVFNKQQKNSFKTNLHEDTNLSYQGTYEKDFLDFCFNKNIELLKLDNNGNIDYLFKNKKCKYYPDFYYKPLNLIIEIKSYYTFNTELKRNLEKQKSSIALGFNFIFIIDKNYDEFYSLLNNCN